MKNQNQAAKDLLETLFNQIADLRSQRYAMMAMLFVLIQTHPDRSALKAVFDLHVEGVISRALQRPEFPDSHIDAIESMRAEFSKALEGPLPPFC